NEEDFNRLLNSLINQIKRLLPSPPPDHMNPPIAPDFYGRGNASGVQLTTSSIPPDFYGRDNARGVQLTTSSIPPDFYGRGNASGVQLTTSSMPPDFYGLDNASGVQLTTSSIPPDFYGRDNARGVQFTTSSMSPNFYEHDNARGVQLTTSPIQMDYNEFQKIYTLKSLNNPSFEHISKSTDDFNLTSQFIQFQNMNRHHSMLDPLDSTTTTHINPYHRSNLPQLNCSVNSNEMINLYFDGLSHSLKDLPPPPPSSNPTQQYVHQLPSLYFDPMHNMDPLLSPSPGDQQQDIPFSSMMDGSFGMGPPHHHLHPLHLDDDRPPPTSQSIHNISIPLTTSIQSSNIQNLDPTGSPGEIQIDTIASSTVVPASRIPPSVLNDQLFLSILENIRIPPSNANINNGQPRP
ncbi:unnamed protein product, partial [Rotaria sp. Silwood2]